MAIKVILFIFYGLVISFAVSFALHEYLETFLKQLSHREIEEMISNPFYEISRTSFNIYIIAYVLFGQLPAAITNQKWFRRGLYFLLFYIFCFAVYLWI